MTAPLDVISPITIANYGRKAWNNLAESFPVANLLRKKGNIITNAGGTSLNWPIEAGRHDVYTVADAQDVTDLYTTRKRFAQPTLNWGEVAAFRLFTKGQLRQNSGEQALVDFKRREIPAMFRDLAVATRSTGGTTVDGGIFWQFLNRNLGSYAGSGASLGGLPSVFTGNSAITWSSNTKTGTINNTNYAGLTCVLNGLSSTVDGAESDAWTPTAINTTATTWGGSASTFAANVFAILNEGISRGTRFSGSDMSLTPDCFLFERSMYVDAMNAITAKQSFLLTGAVGKNEVFGIGMGTQNGVNHAGYPVYWDFNVPASTGYLLNFSQIFMYRLPLFESSGDKPIMSTSGAIDDNVADAAMYETEVKYNDSRRALTCSATFPGQFAINPRYQTMFYAGA